MQHILSLPWPPSVNHYWRQFQGRAILSAAGRRYRLDCEAAAFRQYNHRSPLTGPLSVSIEARQPDRRRRDLDNLPKGILDGLTHSGVWGDDAQIRRLLIEFGPYAAGGEVVVVIEPYGPQPPAGQGA